MPWLPDKSVDLVLCDPPYGTTQCKWDAVLTFESMWRELNRVIKPNAAIAIFGSEPFSSNLRLSNIEQYKYDWIWEKEQGVGFLNSKKRPLANHETISIFSNGPTKYKPQMRTGFKPYKIKKGHHGEIYGPDKGALSLSDGERFPLSVLKFKRDSSKLHPTQKPVALLEYLIKTYSTEGDTVLDFTMGSGSTGVACKNLSRNFIGCELDDKYFRIAENRINGEVVSND